MSLVCPPRLFQPDFTLYGHLRNQVRELPSTRDTTRDSTLDSSTYAKLLLTEISRSLLKSAEVFSNRNRDHGISPHFNDLSGELLASRVATHMAAKIAEKMAKTFTASSGADLPPEQSMVTSMALRK